MSGAIPRLWVGKDDEGILTVAIQDSLGWVKAGTGDPLPDPEELGWTRLQPAATDAPTGPVVTVGMVEAAARAMALSPWDDLHDTQRDSYRLQAEAALKAGLGAA